VDLIGTAAESDAVGAILAAISLAGTELELIANLAGFLFFGYAVYLFLPRVFPEALNVVTDRRGYQVFAVCFVVVVSEPLASIVLSEDFASFRNIIIALASTVTPLVVCLGYVGIIASRDMVNIRPASREVSERFNVSVASGRMNDTERVSLTDHLSDIAYVGFMTAVPLPFLSMAVGVAGLLYPIPEVLAIGWMIINVINTRFGQSVGGRLPSRERVDVEEIVFDLVVNVVRSPKGVPTVLLTLTGFGGAISIFGVRSGNMLQFTREGLITIRSDPFFAWNVLGVGLVSLGSGLFAVWFWARVIRRIPAYFQAWNASKAEGSPLAEESLPVPTTRPVGLLLPFAVTTLPAVAFIQTLRFDYFFDLRTLVLSGYGVVWPLSMVVLGWAVYQTRRTEPQPPSSEGRALPVALLVEVAVVLFQLPIAAYVGQASGMGFSSPIEGVDIILIPTVMIVFMFVIPDLEARANDVEGWRSQQANLAMFVVGLSCAIGGMFNIGSTGLLLNIFAALFIGTPIWDVMTDILL
jgi:hypothetical protein